MSDPFLELLADASLNHRGFSEAIIFAFNRCEDPDSQRSFVKLLSKIILTDSKYFYTNDLSVIVDILLRFITRLSTDYEYARLDMIKAVPEILKIIVAQSANSSYNDVIKVKNIFVEIECSEFSHQDSKTLVSRLLNEYFN